MPGTEISPYSLLSTKFINIYNNKNILYVIICTLYMLENKMTR